MVNPVLSGGNVFFFFLISLLVRLASFYNFIDGKVKGLELSEEVSGIWYKKHISRIIEWAQKKSIRQKGFVSMTAGEKVVQMIVR